MRSSPAHNLADVARGHGGGRPAEPNSECADRGNRTEVNLAQGQYAPAEPLRQRVLAIREKALGPDHPLVAVGLENLVGPYRRTRRGRVAQELESRAASIRASSDGWPKRTRW